LLDHLFFMGSPAAISNRLLFDGEGCHVIFGPQRHMPIDPAYLAEMEMKYLSNLGLRPADPSAGGKDGPPEDARRFPGSIARFETSRVRPAEEAVDGAACVVVEGEHAEDVEGKRQRVREVIWLDPAVGYAPRKWEARTADRLLWRRTNADFREFASGCWLPLAGVHMVGTPGWVAADLRDRPALSYHMRLLWARVNDVPDEVFKPDYGFQR
jgi:hypothetical protein